ncbi:MAG: hypothetical protein GF398_20490 [Chitinivibrionales bacterium]|nr:hypothetical protein [Chitinivibrionales bacterium]
MSKQRIPLPKKSEQVHDDKSTYHRKGKYATPEEEALAEPTNNRASQKQDDSDETG